jgi:hypothetical protein
MAVEIDPSLDYRHWRKDHVSVLPAIHSSFVNYSGRPDVIAGLQEAGFPSFDAINYLSEDGLFRYDAALFSGGGAELDIEKSKTVNASMWQRRDDTVLMSDSGGFQVAKGLWTPKAYYELRGKITAWQEAISDIAIAMDVPTGSVGNRKAICIDSFDECLTLTKDNFDWQVQNRNPKAARMLNVVQGLRAEGHEGALRWYDEIKGYCDRGRWGANAFDGWSFGGIAAQNTATALRLIARMLQDGLLGKASNHQWIHFLGVAAEKRVASFTLIQRAVRRVLDDDGFTVSCDASNAGLSVGTQGMYYADGPWGVAQRKLLNARWFQPTCGRDCQEHFDPDARACVVCAFDRQLDFMRAMGTCCLAEHLSFEAYVNLATLSETKIRDALKEAEEKDLEVDPNLYHLYGTLKPEGYALFTFISQEMFLRKVYGQSAKIVEAKAALVDKLVAALKSETPDSDLAKIKLA